MHSEMLRGLTEPEVEAYRTAGVVFLQGMFDQDWIETLTEGLRANSDEPTHRARLWDRDEKGATMFWDSQAWMRIGEYRHFIESSPAAEIAGRVMGSSDVNFFFDAVFVRSAGSQFQTPWHQDEPYWSVEGHDTCTIWMPLVSVKAKNALAFVPGSHLGREVFEQYNFGAFNPDNKAGVDQVDFSIDAEAAFPDIANDPAAYGVVSWDMEPGDCVVFNSRIMHGGSGLLDGDVDLRVFTSKWLGDDVKINFRAHGMDPDHTEIMTEYGLAPGDRPGTDLYPRIWSNA